MSVPLVNSAQYTSSAAYPSMNYGSGVSYGFDSSATGQVNSSVQKPLSPSVQPVMQSMAQPTVPAVTQSSMTTQSMVQPVVQSVVQPTTTTTMTTMPQTSSSGVTYTSGPGTSSYQPHYTMAPATGSSSLGYAPMTTMTTTVNQTGGEVHHQQGTISYMPPASYVTAAGATGSARTTQQQIINSTIPTGNSTTTTTMPGYTLGSRYEMKDSNSQLPRYEMMSHHPTTTVIPSGTHYTSTTNMPRTLTTTSYTGSPGYNVVHGGVPPTGTTTTTVLGQDYSDSQLYRPDGAMYVSPGGVLRGGMSPLYNMAEVRTYEAVPIFATMGENNNNGRGFCGSSHIGGERISGPTAVVTERGNVTGQSEISSISTTHVKKTHQKHQAKQRFCC